MEKALEVRNLSLCINGQMILDDLSLDLEKGSFTAFCGRNGAGKSQLLRILKGPERWNFQHNAESTLSGLSIKPYGMTSVLYSGF